MRINCIIKFIINNKIFSHDLHINSQMPDVSILCNKSLVVARSSTICKFKLKNVSKGRIYKTYLLLIKFFSEKNMLSP